MKFVILIILTVYEVTASDCGCDRDQSKLFGIMVSIQNLTVRVNEILKLAKISVLKLLFCQFSFTQSSLYK